MMDRSFAVFGYDFMLTEKEDASDVDVWLIEINSSPAVAEKLLPMFATKVIELAIDPILEEEDQGSVLEHGEDQRQITADTTLLGVEDFITLDC